MMNGSTVQITDLVRVCPSVYANESSMVMVSSKDEWEITIHLCNPVWTDEFLTGMDVTSYTYSSVADSYRKVTLYSVAGVQIYCLLQNHKCYCSRLSRNQCGKTTDSIKHTLTLFPSPVVTPNITWPDVIRTKACARVTWGTYREYILSCEEQDILANVSKNLYPKRVVLPDKAQPQPLQEDIRLGIVDLGSDSPCLLMGESDTIGRVGDILFICHKQIMQEVENKPEVSFSDGMVYFPSRGGPASAIHRLRAMLLSLHDKGDQIPTPILSAPLTMCDICGDTAVVLYTNEDGCGFILCQPVAVMVAGACKQHPAGPVHLVSMPLKDVRWMERELLCCKDDPYLETLSERIEKTLQLSMGVTGV